MPSDNEYFSENDEIQSDTINLDNSPREIAAGEAEAEERNDQQDADENDESKKKVVKPKRIIKNPIPKFNEHTIRTEKGLPAVLSHFKDVKFKGRGFEEQDLNRLMKIYEYWCHRFYPKFTFDDCIERLEWLGNKRSAQVYLKKIRMGIEDVLQDKISEENVQEEDLIDPLDDQFDHLLTTRNEKSVPELTEEQLEQINQNRLRAEAIRRERMSRLHGETSQESNTNGVSQNQDKHIETQVEDEELDIDNILKMVNEDSDSSSSNIDKEHLYDKKISNAIRMNVIRDSENEEELDDSLSVAVSSNKSPVLQNSQLRKKRKISTDSDDSDSSRQSQNISKQGSSTLNSDSNSPQSSKDISSSCEQTRKNVLQKISDSEDEQPILSNVSIKTNPVERVDKGKNSFLDSDQESNSDSEGSMNVSKYKSKGRLIIDTDESD